MEMKDLKVGDRVQLHPGTDAWMQGDKFGTVIAKGRRFLKLKMDSGRERLMFANNIIEVVS